MLHLGCAGENLSRGAEACLHYRLSKICSELWGVEIDKAALEQVRSFTSAANEDDRLRYLVGDVQRLDDIGIGRKFDVVLAGSVIEHLDNPGLMLQGAKSLCRAGGEVIIVTPNVFGLMQFLRVLLLRREAVNPQHTCWFSMQTLSELCHRYGLEPTQWHTGFSRRPASWSWSIKRSLGRAAFTLMPQVGGSLIGVFRPVA